MTRLLRCALVTAIVLAACLPLFAADQPAKFVGTVWNGIDNPLFGTVFTQLTPENAGKWSELERTDGVFSWPPLDNLIAVAQKKHIIVKEHTLIWYQQVPRWVTPDNAERAVTDWFDAFKTHFGDKIDMIDVANEVLDGKPVYATGLPGGDTQWGWLVWAFELARKDFPKAKLLINEYGILNSSEKTARYIDVIKILQDMKLVDGVGLQGHGLELTAADTIRANLKAIETLGLPVYITEWDLNQRDDQKQLAQMQQQFPIFWDDPMVRGITFWGFQVGRTWRADAYLVHGNGTYRPAFRWMIDYMKAN